MSDRDAAILAKLDQLLVIQQRQEARLAGIDNRLDGIDNRLAGIDNRLQTVERDVRDVKERVGTVDARLAALEASHFRTEGQLSVMLQWLQSMDQRFSALMAPVVPPAPKKPAA